MTAAGVDNVTIDPASLADLVKPVLTGGTFSYSGVTGKHMTWTTDGSCNKDANIVTLDR